MYRNSLWSKKLYTNQVQLWRVIFIEHHPQRFFYDHLILKEITKRNLIPVHEVHHIKLHHTIWLKLKDEGLEFSYVVIHTWARKNLTSKCSCSMALQDKLYYSAFSNSTHEFNFAKTSLSWFLDFVDLHTFIAHGTATSLRRFREKNMKILFLLQNLYISA